jgi:hypothetical protein
MKIVKLDGRYRYYPEFTQAIYYPLREWKLEQQVVHWCINQYGALEYWDYNGKYPRKTNNPNWRHDKKKRRIYLKNQADISMALLISSG